VVQRNYHELIDRAALVAQRARRWPGGAAGATGRTFFASLPGGATLTISLWLAAEYGLGAGLARGDFANFDPEFLANLDGLAPAVRPVVHVQIKQVFTRFLERDDRAGAHPQKLTHLDLLFGQLDDDGNRNLPEPIERVGFGHAHLATNGLFVVPREPAAARDSQLANIGTGRVELSTKSAQPGE
jgi:hypothetical protein